MGGAVSARVRGSCTPSPKLTADRQPSLGSSSTSRFDHCDESSAGGVASLECQDAVLADSTFGSAVEQQQLVKASQVGTAAQRQREQVSRSFSVGYEKTFTVGRWLPTLVAASALIVAKTLTVHLSV